MKTNKGYRMRILRNWNLDRGGQGFSEIDYRSFCFLSGIRCSASGARYPKSGVCP